MSFKPYIDRFMEKHGSADPELQAQTKQNCVRQLAALLAATPPGAGGAQGKEATLGDVCYYLELYPQALDYYDAALKITPDDYHVIRCKIYTLLHDADKNPAAAFIEEVLGRLGATLPRTRHCELKIHYLNCLSETGQVSSVKYTTTLDYLLAQAPENIYTHVYAARYHDAQADKVNYAHHMAQIAELTRENETQHAEFSYSPEVAPIMAAAARTALALRDKRKTWLLIAHLMNSGYDSAALFELRSAAAAAFPASQNQPAGRNPPGE